MTANNKQVKPALIQFIEGVRTKQQLADYEQAKLNGQKVISINGLKCRKTTNNKKS